MNKMLHKYLIIFTLTFTNTPINVEAIEHIVIYGSRYDIEDLWDSFRFDYKYDTFTHDYQLSPSLAEERACNAIMSERPSGCTTKPQQLTQPRTNGCSNAPDGAFLGACNNHDICYDNISTGKEQCDSNFLSDMYTTCDYVYMTSGRNKICKGVANTYYRAVVVVGNSAYYSSQSEAKCAAWWSLKEAFCK